MMRLISEEANPGFEEIVDKSLQHPVSFVALNLAGEGNRSVSIECNCGLR